MGDLTMSAKGSSVNTDSLVVDGANVAYAELSHAGDPKVSNLVAMNEALQQEGYEPIVIIDASLRYDVDDPDQLEALLDDHACRQAPAGTDADYFILETADRLEAWVVSNDEFEDWLDDYPWIEERRVPFMIIRGEIELYSPYLPGREKASGE